MTTKSNLWLALMACLFFSYSVNAQLYGDIHDVNGQNNIGIGTSSPTTNLHIVSNYTADAVVKFESYYTSYDFITTANGSFHIDFRNYSNGFQTGRAISIERLPGQYYSNMTINMKQPSLFSSRAEFSSLAEFYGTSTFNSKAIFNNKIGIGTNVPQASLHVKGGGILVTDISGANQFLVTRDGEITARQIDVHLNAIVPDYVFETDYDLMSLTELSNYIQENKHLPKIKSAQEYEETGTVDIGELQLQLLEKVEELTLYTIEQQKQIELLTEKLNKLESKKVKNE